MLIPWTTIQELDGLKNASSTYGEANLSQLARNAIRFIYDSLSHGTPGLRGQKISESIDPSQTGDDAILDCARYWRERQAAQVVLLSNDRNLCTKTMIHGIGAISHEPAQTASSVLNQVLENWSIEHNQDSSTAGQDFIYSIIEDEDTDMIIDEVTNTSPQLKLFRKTINSTEPEESTFSTTEMQTDPILAPIVKANERSDPFEKLLANTSESRYSRNAKSIRKPAASPPSTRRRAANSGNVDVLTEHRARSYSPEEMVGINISNMPTISNRSRSASSSPTSDFAPVGRQARSPTSRKNRPLDNVLTTVTSAFPGLIRHHLFTELKDSAFVDLVLAGTDSNSLYELLLLLETHWLPCFKDICKCLIPYRGIFKVYCRSLCEVFRQQRVEPTAAQEAINAVASIWRDLSKYRGNRYKKARDEEIERWVAAWTR